MIANHEAALDFVNLIGATSRPMHFVISKSFYSTLPVKGYMDKMGVIPKQQFQTNVHDLKQMKSVIDHGQPLVIYPAGLMCEDGLSTPIPAATYKFLKWLDADVYMAHSSGSYFVMPKWTKGMRPGRTYMDIYKLFDREEMKSISLEEVRRRTDEALLFDAYREQERNQARYYKNRNIQGLQNVLYWCPVCRKEHTIEVREEDTLVCAHCGFSQKSDAYGFLHKTSEIGEEIRYVSDWSRMIYRDLKEKILDGRENSLSMKTIVSMVNGKKKRFEPVGEGTLTLSAEGFSIIGTIHSEPVSLQIPIGNIPTLPFSPGKYLEVQHGGDIYRCALEDGALVMKFINMVKVFYELSQETHQSAKQNCG